MGENEIKKGDSDSQLTPTPPIVPREEEAVEKAYRLLQQFGVNKPEDGGLIDKAVRELGGVIGRIELPTGEIIKRTESGGYTDGKTLVEYGIDGKIVRRDNDGTTYDEDGNVLVPGQPTEE